MHEIIFEHNEENNHLKVTIETERLYLNSVSSANFDDYKNLLGNSENLHFYRDGKAFSTDELKTRFSGWVSRWENNIPFSALAVSKKENDDFIGHVVLGYGGWDDLPGSAELAFVFGKKFWGQGYGKESVGTVVKDYAPELAKRNYKIEGNDFTSVVATSHPDNVASIKILKAANMHIIREEEKFGRNRYVFFANIAKPPETKFHDAPSHTPLRALRE